MGSLGTSLVAWIGLPVVLYAGSTGLGLLCERVARFRLPDGLLAPVGFCVATALLLAPYRLEGGAWVAAVLFVVAALVGFVWARDGLPRRLLRPGWIGIAGLAVYALYMAPVLAAGGWTWTGYNFVNDTAVQFVLADHLSAHGTAAPPGPPPYSTAAEHVRIYFVTGYPLGIHSLLATLDLLVPAPLPAIYQPLIASAAAFAAMALATLAAGAGLARPLAATAGATAMAANLTYNYGLQGNAKEVAFVTALAVAAAVCAEALSARRPVRVVAVAALCLAGALALFSVAALPYVGALALALLLGALFTRSSPLRRRLPSATAVGIGVLALASLPTLVTIVRFGEVATGTFGTDAEAGVIQLGHLARPLPLPQAGGVWLTGDYRFPVLGLQGTVTAVLIVGMALALVLGVAWLVRRRQLGPLLLLVAGALTLAVVHPRVSPYAGAKLLAILSPAVVLVAAIGLAAAARRTGRLRLVAYVAAAALALGVVASDGFAYRQVRLAPVDRLQALSEAADHVPRRERELYMIDDFEEFAKYFADGRQNVALETITPSRVRDQVVQPLISFHADIDQMPPAYVASFRSIVQRRGPTASRAPASYELVYQNRWYTVWSRRGPVDVVAHVPLQGLDSRSASASCGPIRRLVGLAEPGDRVTAARGPEVVLFDTVTAAEGLWPAAGRTPSAVAPSVPGTATTTLEFGGGRYRVWVRASSGRRFDVSVAGRRVASVRGVNTPGGWLPGGTVDIPAGPQEIALSRPGWSLRPGDRFIGELGPLAFERVGGSTLEHAAPAQAVERFCEEPLDWVALTRRSAR